MADKDDELVIVHLDQALQYRDRETYLVHTVGPGRAEVPAYMAKKWKVKPASEARAEARAEQAKAANG